MKSSMKFIRYFCLGILALSLASCNYNSKTAGRVDQFSEDVATPMPVKVTSVTPIAGGAVIKVDIPDDNNIKGVVASYQRHGETVECRISRYIDTLVVEGLADLNVHEVEVSSFNINNDVSESVKVEFTPLPSAVMTVDPILIESFGGVKVHVLGNESKADLAVCLLVDNDLADTLATSVHDMKWVEVTTMFTGQNDIKLTRRNLEPERAIYGVFCRDRWNNYSDTVWTVLTPLVEVKIPKQKTVEPRSGILCMGYSQAMAQDDNLEATSSSYPVTGLWDDSNESATSHFLATKSESPMPGWITLDLGAVVSLSRIGILQRRGYLPYSGAAVRDLEFWGCKTLADEPNTANEHGFNSEWFCLGKFSVEKPSGFLDDGTPGEITYEDLDYYNNVGGDFELNPDLYPRCNDELRYLRVVIANTFATFELKTNVGAASLAEVTAYGKVISQ